MNILLGVSGSIALYRACELVRSLTKKNHLVRVIMTRTAEKWISPTLFASLSGQTVYTNRSYQSMPHIDVRKGSDIFLIAPATAHLIAKAACGLADDVLSTTMLAFENNIHLAPAMNPHMYNHPIVQKNIATLKEIGYHILEPISGEAVCGDSGEGKMMLVDDIMQHIQKLTQ